MATRTHAIGHRNAAAPAWRTTAYVSGQRPEAEAAESSTRRQVSGACAPSDITGPTLLDCRYAGACPFSRRSSPGCAGFALVGAAGGAWICRPPCRCSVKSVQPSSPSPMGNSLASCAFRRAGPMGAGSSRLSALPLVFMLPSRYGRRCWPTASGPPACEACGGSSRVFLPAIRSSIRCIKMDGFRTLEKPCFAPSV